MVSWKVDELKQEIARYRGTYGLLSQADSKALNTAYEQLAKIRGECYHRFETQTTFTSVMDVCHTCGAEKPTSE